MHIAIIGPGYMTIPPVGWGAVEILIDDIRNSLQELGHKVSIVNTPNLNYAVGITNALNPDIVHIHYDDYSYLAHHINCKNIILTSHFAYLEQPSKWSENYSNFFWEFINTDTHIFCLSKGILDMYRKGGKSEERLHLVHNGVRTDLFKFNEVCERPNDSLYLGKIDARKRQAIFQKIDNLYFVGRIEDPEFKGRLKPTYLNEWNKEQLYRNLTKFANLALLSDGEAHPLVCMEALSAGLGLVISEYAAANLNTSLPFIDVVPESKIHDLDYVRDVLEKNRKISIKMRNEIREYAMNFNWIRVVREKYVKSVERILEGNNEQ